MGLQAGKGSKCSGLQSSGLKASRDVLRVRGRCSRSTSFEGRAKAGGYRNHLRNARILACGTLTLKPFVEPGKKESRHQQQLSTSRSATATSLSWAATEIAVQVHCIDVDADAGVVRDYVHAVPAGAGHARNRITYCQLQSPMHEP